MAYDEFFADRLRQTFKDLKVAFTEKKMMGGLIFMVDEKMCVGVDKDKKTGEDRLMARIGQDEYLAALKEQGSREMDFTGTPMKGFVFIGPDGFDSDDDLEYWLRMAIKFNPQARKTNK
jgi:hypothetical protein